MKKVSILIVSILLSTLTMLGQSGPVLQTHVDFESGSLNGWTVSSGAATTTAMHSTGSYCLKMTPSASAVTFTSPTINITAGYGVRLEFSHIPMLDNQHGGKVQISKNGGQTWTTLDLVGTTNPSCYDRSYFPGGITSPTFMGFTGEFYKTRYWTGTTNIPEDNLDSSYWRNEVFYLSNKLGQNTTSFQIRFILPAGATSFSGWYIDDIRLYVGSAAGNEVRVPQIKSYINYPNMTNYPNCSDAQVSFEIKDAQGAMTTVSDSIYIEYYTEGNHTKYHTTLANMGNDIYTGYIPFAGVDSTIYWRAVINDAMFNKVTFPYVYGTYSKFKSIRPYVGNKPIQTTNTSSQELVLKSNMTKAMYQMRYTASELQAAGFKAGKIGGLGMNITSAATGTSLPNFKLYIGNIPTTTVLDNQFQYGATELTQVYNKPNYVIPAIGETYIKFDSNIVFMWDGMSDLLIKTCFGDLPSSSGTTKIESIPASGGSITYCYESSTSSVTACDAPFNTSNPSIGYRPNFRFDFVNNCFFKTDAGVKDTLLSPAHIATCMVYNENKKTGFVTANTPATLRIFIKNDGTDTLYSTKIKWKIDQNTHIDSIVWYGHMRPNDSVAYTLTNSLLIPEGQHNLTVWSEMITDDTIDWNYDNDTTFFYIISTAGPMHGDYAIGGTVAGISQNKTFSKFEDAFNMLVGCGVNGPVRFKVKASNATFYNTPLKFPKYSCISGLSATNNITFIKSDTINVRFSMDTLPTGYQAIFDLSSAKYINFVGFNVQPVKNQDAVLFDANSSNISFKQFNFVKTILPDSVATVYGKIMNIGSANNISIDSCLFNVNANAHIYIKGLSPVNENKNISITNSTFNVMTDYSGSNNNEGLNNMTNNCIYAEYTKNLVISKNNFISTLPDNISVLINQVKYNVLVQNSDSVKVNRNRFYTKGTSAIIFSAVNNSIFANNKISVENNTESSSSNYCYGLNMISGQNNIIAYNNIYTKSMTRANKKSIGLVLGSLGSTTLNNKVKNNIIVSEGYGYSVTLNPSVINTNQSFNISNNSYFKQTGSEDPLFSSDVYGAITNTATWIMKSLDTNSIYDQNPMFLSWDNLHTFNTFVCQKGITIIGITDDYNGHNRPTTIKPCIGAEEFAPPTSNIYVTKVGLLSGNYSQVDNIDTYTACDFGQDSVFIQFKDISANTIPANTMKLYYSVNNTVSPAVTFTDSIYPDTLYTIVFPTTHNFAATNHNTIYNLRGWSSLVADTVNLNDTISAKINSLYQLPALSAMNTTIGYGNSTLLNVTSNDSIYWFYGMNDDNPFRKSHSLQTSRLYSDTTLYFSRKSEIPVLKITEIQLTNSSSAVGQTQSLPTWASGINNIYEISNFGNGDIDLTGYKFCYIVGTLGGTDTLVTNINKTYTFPNGYILPSNKSICLVARNAAGFTGSDSVALPITAGSVYPTTKAGFFIQDANNVIVDAVSINGALFNRATNVQSSVWTGTITDTLIGKAGIYRTNANSTTNSGWAVANADNALTIGTFNNNLVVSSNNGCYGFKTPYNIHVNGIPPVDPGIIAVSINNVTDTVECTLTQEQIKVRLINTGTDSIKTDIPIICKVYENNIEVGSINDLYTGKLASFDTIDYVLNGTLNLTANDSNRYFTIIAYTNLTADTSHLNDTSFIHITSLNTPLMPISNDVSIPYAQSTLLTATAANNNTIIWYNDPYTTQELSRNTYQTPILYTTDTFYVGSMLQHPLTATIGTGTTTNAQTGYPSPLNCYQKQVKEQYLVRTSDLINGGMTGNGNMSSIAFNISNITFFTGKTTDTILNYTIKVGTTTDSVLSTWESGLTEVYNIDTLHLTSSDINTWKIFNFTEPYYWDGVSNLVVEVCFSSPSNYSRVQTKYTPKTYTAALSYRSASVNACQWTGNPSSSSQQLPNMQIGFNEFGCNSVRKPVIVTVAPPPTCDAGLLSFTEPVGQTIMSGLPTPVKVILKNFGSDTLKVATINWTINGVNQTPYTWTGNLPINTFDTVQIGSPIFHSGQISLIASVNSNCTDTLHSNDTAQLNLSACMGNNIATTTLTIGAGASYDYHSFAEAINAVVVSGLCGPIVFNVAPGTYNEKIVIPQILGSSSTNTITFKGQTTEKPILKYVTTTNDNITVRLDSTANINFENIEILNSKETNPTLVNITKSNNINFTNVLFSSPVSTVTNLVNLQDVNNLVNFVKDTFDCGLNSIVSFDDSISNNLMIDSCLFTSFQSNALDINSCENVIVKNNKITTNTSIKGENIRFNKIAGTSKIVANDIYNVGGTLLRKGIEVKRSNFTMNTPLAIYNNSVSLVGPANNSTITYVGLDIDSSTYINIYYNTLRVFSVRSAMNTKTIAIGKTLLNNINIRNNNIDNSAGGYAYYVQANNTMVTSSDNNNYYSNGTRFAYWGTTNALNIATLRTTNGYDMYSVSVENPFTSDSVLSLLYPTPIVRAAEPLADVLVDIRGLYRPISPKPTIGAYEYVFANKDAGITEIKSPINTIKYIENDSLVVKVKVKNFGNYTIDTIKFVAELKYHRDDATNIQTATEQYVGTLASLDTMVYTFNTIFYPPLNTPITDSLYLRVYTQLKGDSLNNNDSSTVQFLVIPAKNLQDIKTNNILERCKLYNVQVSAVLKNVGEKPIVNSDSIYVTYEVQGRPDLKVKERLVLPYTDATGTYSSIQKNSQITYTFNQTANLYPLGLNDTTWKMRTYITMGKDHVPANDTSNYITINSRRSPNQPIAYNDTIPYATWGHPSAAQEDGLIIRWFKDSTDVAPFYSPSTYVNSQNYTTTQMFTDSTYYLRVNLTGSYPCPSYYTPIHVVLKNRAPVDASAISVVEPPAPGWVYMTDQDTIKAVITNYGTTPLTSFNVSYSIRATNPPNQTPTVVTEVCHATIQPDGLYTYKFNTLANFSDPTKIYEVRVWTGATNDITALNDTTPYLYVHPKNGTTIYPNATVSNGNSIDITKVRMATIENESTPSASTYSNYTETVPPIVVFKGTDDTLFVKIDRASTMKSDANVAGWIGVYIDYDRDGMFIGQAVGTATQITSYLGDVVYLDTITNEKVGKEIGIKIHIPDTAMNGYRRMRIVVNQDANFNNVYSFNLQKGEIEDYKIQIRNMEDVNAELMRFVTPVKDTLTRQALKVELKNTGRQTLTNATITWKLNEGLSNTFNWSGNLTTSQTTIVFLDSITLNQGNNSLLAYVDVAGDAYHGNDTLKHSVNIIHAYKLTYENKFDLQAGASDFYADEINPYTPSNCWEYGTPAQTNTTIKSAYSAPNCWKTKLNGTYTRNTESILYSPVFNTGVIKPDTLSFMMKKAMNSGASMTIEYTDWSSRNISEPHWVKLGAKNDGYGTNWYNDTTGFTGTANAWQKVSYSLEHLNHLGMIGNHMQLRFIFKSNSGTPGDGIAIDDFKLYRGRRHQDIGVVAVEVTPLSMPNYGSYFYPKVKIVNFGTDTLTSFKVCYFSEDMYIPQCETLMGQNFKPDDTISYTFNQGHYLNVGMPDPFALCAFTRLGQEDIYSDNDSTCTSIVIGPLEKDAAILEIASPTNLVSSNDDVDIDIKIKNYGLQPITTLPVGFYIPGNAIVHDTITFNPPLNSGQEYTYRFPQKYHASFGIVNLKCWVGLDGDYYHDNDTIYKRIEGTNTTHDLEAKSVILDETSDPNNVIVGLKFYNKSSIGVGNIKVGYYVNGNSNNTIEETYRAGGIVPSSTYACHTFSTKLPKSGGPYQSVCAYVTIADENDRSNDTTCEMYTAQRDGVADTIFIEETVEPTVLVQLIGHNGGTIGGASTPVRAHIVLNNDFSHVYTQTFNWVFDEPNPLYKAYMTFTERLPKSANGQYNIVGWIEYPNDINHRNDTTRAYKVKGYVGLDDSIANNGEFVLEQNKPNPFNTTTTIGFNLPHQGKINFYIVNSVGQVVYRKDGDYPEGHNTISFNRETLPQGIYYYIMQFDKEKLTKKMVIIR